MLNKALLNLEIQNFIINFQGEISTLAFAGSPFMDVSVQELIQQIEGRKKAEKKLPQWHSTKNILFPPKLNLEQTSSEITAKYKASLITGKTLADITGGFGVDSFYFSEKIERVHHFEINQSLSEIATHNFEVFDKKNILCFAKDGLQMVRKNKYDVVYADPSRRNQSKGKVFFLKDCEPNIPENISEIMHNCELFLLKTSPMLDISIGLQELIYVAEIHIIAVMNDVKELLWLLKKDAPTVPKIKTVNFTKSGTETFNFEWGATAQARYSLPKKYVYEPNASIMKSGAFEMISERYKVEKLHKNTHLYTANTLMDFPGRSFLIEKIIPYKKSEMRSAINFTKANIVIRNFSESIETLRKKWKIVDGGSIYLFFVTNLDNKKEMLVCTKA